MKYTGPLSFFFPPFQPPRELHAPFLISSMLAIIPSQNLPPANLPGHKKVSSLIPGPLPSTLESRNSKVSEYDSNYQKAL